MSKKETSPATGTSLENDPHKNAVADKIIAMLMGDEERPEDDDNDETYGGIPLSMVKEAGKALANRYCFAISTDEYGTLAAMITPTRYFEENGCCDDQDGPISDILPPRVGNAMEATWEFYDEKIKTPLDAAHELQAYGFVWNKAFQEYIDEGNDVKVLPMLKELDSSAQSKQAKKPRGPAL